MNTKMLIDTARTLVADDKGLLAMDESNPTCNKRFAKLGIPQTADARRAYRELIVTAPGLGESISGAILYDETIRQQKLDGTPFAKALTDAGIIPGIKVDTGAKDLAAHPGEKITEGLDGLRERLAEYFQMGARFAKWRAVIAIGENIPSRSCLEANAQTLARYAALCQEAGLVPIVEPEVLMDGAHTLEQCRKVTVEVLRNVFIQLNCQRVLLEGMILKPNMVLPGLDLPGACRRHSPPATPSLPVHNGGYRAKVVRQVKDPFIRAFWAEEYENYDERFKREAIAPIQNKIGQFLLNPVIRNILGQVRKRVDIPFVMDHGRLFIANLSKGQLGHDKANLLGSLLVTQFQLGAMARANRPEGERRDFYLFIDEFQNFSTDAFASILAEARKYRLCLTLSHQYIDQLPEPIRQAVFGNVGTLIAFRIGYTDAEVMTKEFGKEIPATALADLERYEAVVKLLVGGSNRQPFRAQMRPPLENRVGRGDKLIALSRERFAVRREKIESKLRRWMTSFVS